MDHLAAGNWMFAAAHTPEHSSPPERPQPVPRPAVDETERLAERETPAASREEIAQFFGVRARR